MTLRSGSATKNAMTCKKIDMDKQTSILKNFEVSIIFSEPFIHSVRIVIYIVCLGLLHDAEEKLRWIYRKSFSRNIFSLTVGSLYDKRQVSVSAHTFGSISLYSKRRYYIYK